MTETAVFSWRRRQSSCRSSWMISSDGWHGSADKCIPLESRIHEFQSEYYDAIARCHKEGRSDIFIEFMLEKIDETLAVVLQHTAVSDYDSQYVSCLLAAMEYNIPYTVPQLLEHLGLKSKETLRRHYLAPALGSGLIEMTVPDKPTSRNQRYIKRS